MTYPNERIPELVQILDEGPGDRPGRGRADHRGGLAQAPAGAGQVVHPQGGRAAGRAEDPRPQLGPAGVPQVGRRSRTCGCCRPGSPASRRSRWRSCRTSTTSTTCRSSYASGRARRSSSFISDAYRYILQVLRMVMYFNPLKVLMPPALWLVGIGLVKGVVDMVRHGVLPDQQHRRDLPVRAAHRLAGAAGRPDRAVQERVDADRDRRARPTPTRAAAPRTPPSWRTACWPPGTTW